MFEHFRESQTFRLLGTPQQVSSPIWNRNRLTHTFVQKNVQVFKNESTLQENPWRESVQLVYFTMLPICLLASACRYHDCLPDKIMHNHVPACSKYVWTCTMKILRCGYKTRNHCLLTKTSQNVGKLSDIKKLLAAFQANNNRWDCRFYRIIAEGKIWLTLEESLRYLL